MKIGFYTTTLLALAILFSSCASTTRLLDEGRYEELITRAHKKLAGRKNKKKKYVKALEEGFRRVNQDDMAQINVLKRSDDPGDWERILHIADRIESRQRLLAPFLPLTSGDGYRARFTFIKTDEIRRYARDQVVLQLYARGMEELFEARRGSKISARNAYASFDRILDYVDHYKDARALRDEARELGVVRVRVGVENQIREWIPEFVESSFERDLYTEDGFWTQYTTDEMIDADIQARLIVTDIDIGPESIRETEVEYSRKIREGWVYVLDENGNVMKDSLGNDVKEERFVRVHASVIRTHQEKIARITALIRVVDLHTQAMIDSDVLHAEARFHHMGQTFFGDERALDSKDRKHIGLLPFPPDAELMLQASAAIKPMFVRHVEQGKYLST